MARSKVAIAAARLPADEVLQLQDYPAYSAYFDLLELPLPANRADILALLADGGLIQSCEVGGWDITNQGTVLFAKGLDDFRSLLCKGDVGDPDTAAGVAWRRTSFGATAALIPCQRGPAPSAGWTEKSGASNIAEG